MRSQNIPQQLPVFFQKEEKALGKTPKTCPDILGTSKRHIYLEDRESENITRLSRIPKNQEKNVNTSNRNDHRLNGISVIREDSYFFRFKFIFADTICKFMNTYEYKESVPENVKLELDDAGHYSYKNRKVINLFQLRAYNNRLKKQSHTNQNSEITNSLVPYTTTTIIPATQSNNTSSNDWEMLKLKVHPKYGKMPIKTYPRTSVYKSMLCYVSDFTFVPDDMDSATIKRLEAENKIKSDKSLYEKFSFYYVDKISQKKKKMVVLEGGKVPCNELLSKDEDGDYSHNGRKVVNGNRLTAIRRAIKDGRLNLNERSQVQTNKNNNSTSTNTTSTNTTSTTITTTLAATPTNTTSTSTTTLTTSTTPTSITTATAPKIILPPLIRTVTPRASSLSIFNRDARNNSNNQIGAEKINQEMLDADYADILVSLSNTTTNAATDQVNSITTNTNISTTHSDNDSLTFTAALFSHEKIRNDEKKNDEKKRKSSNEISLAEYPNKRRKDK